jgi:hypothetical protein
MNRKDFEKQDPMELMGMVMPGDENTLEEMAECFIDEYARLGWGERQIMALFVSPMFMATHRVYRTKGEDYVRDLIQKRLDIWHPNRKTSDELKHD